MATGARRWCSATRVHQQRRLKIVAAAFDRTEAGPDGHLLGHHSEDEAEQLIREQQPETNKATVASGFGSVSLEPLAGFEPATC